MKTLFLSLVFSVLALCSKAVACEGRYETHYQTVLVCCGHYESRYVQPQYYFGRCTSNGGYVSYYVPPRYEQRAFTVYVPGNSNSYWGPTSRYVVSPNSNSYWSW